MACLSRASSVLLAFALLLGIPAAGRATDYAWNGSSSTAWATAANWIGGIAPSNSLTTDTVTFNLPAYGGDPVFNPHAGTISIAGITIANGAGAMPVPCLSHACPGTVPFSSQLERSTPLIAVVESVIAATTHQG